MISERSCDTEDWSNDAENSALHQLFGSVFIIFVLNLYFRYLSLQDIFLKSVRSKSYSNNNILYRIKL